MLDKGKVQYFLETMIRFNTEMSKNLEIESDWNFKVFDDILNWKKVKRKFQNVRLVGNFVPNVNLHFGTAKCFKIIFASRNPSLAHHLVMSSGLSVSLFALFTLFLSSFEFTTSCKPTIAKILHRSFQLRNYYVILQNPFYWSIFKLINSVVYITNIHGLYRPIYKPHIIWTLWTPYLLPRRKSPFMGLDEITY